VSVEFEYFPGLVDVVHDGKLPTTEGWRDSLLAIDALVATLRAEISQIDARSDTNPGAISQLADQRKDLEERLQVALRKRETIEGALAAGLVRDPVQAPENANSAARTGGNQE
jgi:chromosome segregation ATPase